MPGGDVREDREGPVPAVEVVVRTSVPAVEVVVRTSLPAVEVVLSSSSLPVTPRRAAHTDGKWSDSIEHIFIFSQTSKWTLDFGLESF